MLVKELLFDLLFEADALYNTLSTHSQHSFGHFCTPPFLHIALLPPCFYARSWLPLTRVSVQPFDGTLGVFGSVKQVYV